MKNIEILKTALKDFSGMSEEAFDLSSSYWQEKYYKKGELFNNQGSVCRQFGFIHEGIFRAYIIDEKTGKEKNIFFYTSNGFVTAYKSFINQIPCEYFTEAITEAKIITINFENLQILYRESFQWQHFGRLVAEMAATLILERLENFLLMNPEEHYLKLIKTYHELNDKVSLYHISSYLGIEAPSLSRIRKRISQK